MQLELHALFYVLLVSPIEPRPVLPSKSKTTLMLFNLYPKPNPNHNSKPYEYYYFNYESHYLWQSWTSIVTVNNTV